MKNAMVLCSGGLDSVLTAHYAKKSLKYRNLIILFFNYGQRNISQERKYSKKCASSLKAEFHEIRLPWLSKISTSLLNSGKKANKLKRKDLKDTKKESANWYVPARNLIFLSNAIALAESLLIKTKKRYDIFVGFKNEGRESYPDTSPEFLNSINDVSKISSLGKFRILAPLLKKDKEDIVSLGKKLNLNFEDTFSCYVGGKKHCGTCLACRLRQEGFYWANTKDPTDYASK